METAPAPKKRKKGQQQKQSQVHALLMIYLATGVLSGAQCHKVAQAAATDVGKAKEGYEFPDLLTWPAWNMAKTCQRQWTESWQLNPIYQCPWKSVCLTMKRRQKLGSFFHVLPHEIFAAMYRQASTYDSCGDGLPYEFLVGSSVSL